MFSGSFFSSDTGVRSKRKSSNVWLHYDLPTRLTMFAFFLVHTSNIPSKYLKLSHTLDALANLLATSFQPSRTVMCALIPHYHSKPDSAPRQQLHPFSKQATAKKWAINLMKAKRSEKHPCHSTSGKMRLTFCLFVFAFFFSSSTVQVTSNPCLLSWECHLLQTGE